MRNKLTENIRMASGYTLSVMAPLVVAMYSLSSLNVVRFTCVTAKQTKLPTLYLTGKIPLNYSKTTLLHISILFYNMILCYLQDFSGRKSR